MGDNKITMADAMATIAVPSIIDPSSNSDSEMFSKTTSNAITAKEDTTTTALYVTYSAS
jgi:hypothetical protein